MPSNIEIFASGGEQLRRAVAGLSPEELAARPGPGAWSTQEVVIHLADMDIIAVERMKRILTEDNPPLLNADEDAYIAKLHPEVQSVADAVELFDLNRRQFARVLRVLPEAAFARSGTHSSRGPLSLTQIIASYIGHLDHHLEFIRQKRIRLGKPLPG